MGGTAPLYLLFCTDTVWYNIGMKVRFDMRIDKELREFLHAYAKANHTTASRILTDYIVGLKKRHAKDLSVPDLSNDQTTPDA